MAKETREASAASGGFFVALGPSCYASETMARSVTLALTLAVVGVGASPACTAGPGREDVAIGGLLTRMCDLSQECDCVATGSECGAWTSFEPRGTFDEECLQLWIEWADELGCGGVAVPLELHLCPLYHGTLLEGMQCHRDLDGGNDDLLSTDCGRGLVCVADECRDPASITFGREGQPCDLAFVCDEGLYCTRDGTCERLPGHGEPCPDWRCRESLLCDEVCLPLPPAGQPCLQGECAEGSSCVNDQCERLLAVGQPCTGHRQCVSGNCPAGFCAPVPVPGDPCSSRLPCGPDQLCVDEVCVEVYGGGSEGGGAVAQGPTCELLWLF